MFCMSKSKPENDIEGDTAFGAFQWDSYQIDVFSYRCGEHRPKFPF